MRVILDPSKVIYDGKSFVVVYTNGELLDKWDDLQASISEDQEDE